MEILVSKHPRDAGSSMCSARANLGFVTGFRVENKSDQVEYSSWNYHKSRDLAKLVLLDTRVITQLLVAAENELSEVSRKNVICPPPSIQFCYILEYFDLGVRFFNLNFRQEGEVRCENKVDIRFLREILHKYWPRHLFWGTLDLGP